MPWMPRWVAGGALIGDGPVPLVGRRVYRAGAAAGMVHTRWPPERPSPATVPRRPKHQSPRMPRRPRGSFVADGGGDARDSPPRMAVRVHRPTGAPRFLTRRRRRSLKLLRKPPSAATERHIRPFARTDRGPGATGQTRPRRLAASGGRPLPDVRCGHAAAIPPGSRRAVFKPPSVAAYASGAPAVFRPALFRCRSRGEAPLPPRAGRSRRPLGDRDRW